VAIRPAGQRGDGALVADVIEHLTAPVDQPWGMREFTWSIRPATACGSVTI